MSPNGRKTVAVLLAALVSLPVSMLVEPGGAAAAHGAPGLPLGPVSLSETRVEQQLAPGLTMTTITRGHRDPAHECWTIGVNLPVGPVGPDPDPDADKGSLGSLENARAVAAQLTAAPEVVVQLAARGWQPRIEPVDWAPVADGYRPGVLGYTLRIGCFAAAPTAADPLMAALIAARFSAFAVYTGQDGRPDNTGPWVVRVLTIDPHRFAGRVTSTTGAAVSGQETTSAMARTAGAVYAVNGGFFVISPNDGIPGTPAGLSVVDGTVQTGATNGRVALVLADGGRRSTVERLFSRYSISIGTTVRQVDGLNRPPGVVRDCGGVGGDQPTQRPVQDFTCSDPNELVAFTSPASTRTGGPGLEVVVDARGMVTAVRPRTVQSAPAGSTILQAIGTEADWLAAHAQVGSRIRLNTDVVDGRGRPVRLERDDSVVNGGPTLVHRGRVDIDARAEGMLHEDPSLCLPPSGLGAAFGYNWLVRDNPRTGAGVDRQGRLLLVQVDGRQDTVSQGLGVEAFARVMRSLGAVEAINLDGGGSSATVVDGALVSSPSDVDGQGHHVERAVGDAVVVVPTGRR